MLALARHPHRQCSVAHERGEQKPGPGTRGWVDPSIRDGIKYRREAGQDGRRSAAEGEAADGRGGEGSWERRPARASRERRGGPVGPLGLGESGFAGLGLGRIELGRPRGEPT